MLRNFRRNRSDVDFARGMRRQRGDRPRAPELVSHRGDARPLGFGGGRRQIERDAGALPQCAVDRQAPAMALDQTIDDAESEPGAAMLARQAAIHLPERMDRHRGRLWGDAAALIGDADPHKPVAASDGDPDRRARFAELRRVGEQFQQHLLDGAAVGIDRAWRPADAQRDVAALTRLALAELVKGRFDRFRYVDALQLQRKPAGFELRDRQDVDDKVEHLPAGLAGIAGVINVASLADRPESLPGDHFAEADDGVEGRAQLVAHRGEKSRLRRVRRTRVVAGRRQFELVAFALGDVLAGALQIGRLVSISCGFGPQIQGADFGAGRDNAVIEIDLLDFQTLAQRVDDGFASGPRYTLQQSQYRPRQGPVGTYVH